MKKEQQKLMKQIKVKVLIIAIFAFNTIMLNAKEFKKILVNEWEYKKFEHPTEAYNIDGRMFLEGEDHTCILQSILNNHRIVVLPNIILNINHNGVNLKNNTQLYFQESSALKMIPNDKREYSIIKVNNLKNVDILNPQLIGDREEHKNSSGEWGMGITIRSSKNVRVINGYIKDMWGDGIYIGKAGKTKEINNNILVQGGVIDYTRRNGISITSGENIKINNIAIYNIYGTSPMEGIDVEPNKNSVAITDIELKDIRTYNTGFAGIAIALDHLQHLEIPRTKIDVINHVDIGSLYGFRVGYVRDAAGEVNVSNSKWLENIKGPLYFSNIFVSSLHVNFKNNHMDNMTPVTKEVARTFMIKNRPKTIRMKNYNFY